MFTHFQSKNKADIESTGRGYYHSATLKNLLLKQMHGYMFWGSSISMESMEKLYDLVIILKSKMAVASKHATVLNANSYNLNYIICGFQHGSHGTITIVIGYNRVNHFKQHAIWVHTDSGGASKKLIESAC